MYRVNKMGKLEDFVEVAHNMPKRTATEGNYETATCAYCKGSGRVDFTKMCIACGGQGSVAAMKPHRKCAYCKGTGRVDLTKMCISCKGTGWAISWKR